MSENISLSKKLLRKEMRKARKELPAAEKKSGDEKICSFLSTVIDAYPKHVPAFLYMALPDEVLLDPLIEELLLKGRPVAVPRVEGQDMRFYRIHSFSDLLPGSMGIREPAPACAELIPEGSPVIVPGLAFGKDGSRTGYGGGYYDRYFQDRNCELIGVCRSFQIFEAVPAEEFDLFMNRLVSENGLISVPSGGRMKQKGAEL